MTLHMTRSATVTLFILAASCASQIPPAPASHPVTTPAIVAPRPAPAPPTPASPAEQPEQPLTNLKILAHDLEPSPLWWSFGEDMRMLSMPAATAQRLGTSTSSSRITSSRSAHYPEDRSHAPRSRTASS